MDNKMIFAFCVIQIAHVTCLVNTASDDCVTTSKTVICQQTIPKQLPPHVTEVVVQNFTEQNLIVNAFNHRSWASILKLDITVIDKAALGKKYNFVDDLFQPLHNLRTFGYHSPNVGSSVSPSSYSGLNRLTTLDLSGCTWMSITNLMKILNVTNVLPALDTLLLDNVNTMFAKTVDIDQIFVDVMYYKKIKTLSISGITAMIVSLEASNRQFVIESVNLSNARLIPTDLDMLSYDVRTQIRKSVRQFRTLDMSFYLLGEPFKKIIDERVNTDCKSRADPLLHLSQELENLYANGIYVGSSIDNSTFNLSLCSFRMKVIHAKKNGIVKMNCTMQWPVDVDIYELDLSYNQLEYISPSCWHGIYSMKNLFLGSNKLSGMESTPEFSELFQGFPVMLSLNLANNGLSKLPEHIFQTNTLLKVLILCDNLLQSVTFETKQFSALQSLDLSGNMISTFDANSRAKLDNVLNTYTHMNNNSDSATIDISRNPVKCECDRTDSIKWLIRFNERNDVSIACEFENKTLSINDKTLDDVHYQCHKKTFFIAVISSIIAGVVVVYLLILIAHKLYMTRDRKNAVKKFIKDYRRGRLPELYIAMLSYSEHDGDLVWEKIYPVLEKHLQGRVKVDTDVVCIEDKHFIPGRSIVELSMNSIRDSCVVVFVVSRSFCEQNLCHIRVDEAYAQRKPIIIIFLPDVDRLLLPDYLRDIFDRNTRAEFETDINGHSELKPDWPLLCQSIFELASQKRA